MDAGIQADTRTASTRKAKRATRIAAWLPLVAIALWAVVDVALVRYAIDLLPLFCSMVLLAHSVRDAIGDWLAGDTHEGEPDPVWALGVVGLNLFATVFGLLWIFSTSSWTEKTPLAAWIPRPLASMASFAEGHGWGRRAVLPGGPSRPVEARSDNGGSSTPARVAARRSPDGRTASFAEPSGGDAREEVAGTTGRAVANPAPAEREAAPIPTSVSLASSASVLRVRSPVQLTATVTAAGQRPTGSVVFRRDGQIIGSAGVDDQGRAVLNVASLPQGIHTIRAEFAPGADMSRSRSRSLVLFVRP
jgi:hypothetical protein